MERSEAQSDLSEGGVMRDNTLIQSACNIQGTRQGLLICVVSTGEFNALYSILCMSTPYIYIHISIIYWYTHHCIEHRVLRMYPVCPPRRKKMKRKKNKASLVGP